MKKLFILVLSILSVLKSCTQQKSEAQIKNTQKEMGKTIYDYKVEALDGSEINFADYKGKKILIVNTASECGFTPQYEELQALSEKYKDQLVVVGFPANNFGGQEPGSNEEIGAFCQKNFGVTFPMAAKVSVVGENRAPVFTYLSEKELNGVKNTSILWNFTKFLLDENGKLIDSYASSTTPLDDKITKHLN